MSYRIRSATLRDLFVCRRGGEEIPVYPLTLGVTGHRRVAPEAVEIVREQTRDFLTRLADFWRKKQGTKKGEASRAPLVVFNALAAGADSLVAEEVLRLKATRPELDVRLIAVLPAPRAIYEQDFAPGEELDRFRRLLANAADVVELKLTEENRRWLEERPDATLPWELRKAQYEALGRSLAESSLYVLALWDGVEARLENGEVVDDDRGGTADVVRMKTSALPASFDSPVQDEAAARFRERCETLPFGAVFHVATPRDGGASTLASGLKPGQCFVCVGDETTGEEAERLRRLPLDDFNAFFESRWARTQNAGVAPTKARKSVAEKRALNDAKKPMKETALFNRDVVDGYDETRETRRTSVEYLLGDDYAGIDDETKVLVERYAAADAASLTFQGKFFVYARHYLWVLALFNVAICALELVEAPLFDGFPEAIKNIFVGAYYFAFAGFVAMYFWQRRLAYYERYHRYRAFAEALRVQIFWRVAGIADSAGDAYWTHQIKELRWLRFIAKSATASVGAPPQADYAVALTRWVSDQRKFLESRVRKFERQERALETLGKSFACLFALALALRYLPVLLDWRGCAWFSDKANQETCLKSISVLGAALSFIALACFTWNRLRAYGSQRKRYIKSLPIYRRVEKKLTELNVAAVEIGANVDKLDRERQERLRDLGEIALSENADWFLAKRRLELPK